MSGLPDVTALNALGGTKQNAAPVEDDTTDVDASYWNRLITDAAGASHTQPRCWAQVTTAASTGAMVLVAHDSVWGNSAPVAPTLARSGTGIFTITFPATVTDEAGVVHTVALRAGWANFKGTTPYFLAVESSGANVLTLRVFTAAGAANDAVGVTFDVFAV